MERSLELLKEFTEIVGISGDEVMVSRKLKEYFENYNLEIKYDNLGSIFGIKKCGKENAKKVMISTNLDEVGFVVKDIKANGFIEILELGSIKVEYILQKRVKIQTDNKNISGIIIDSVKYKKGRTSNISELLVDIGVSSRKEVLESGINIGKKIFLDNDVEVLTNGKKVISRALSSRCGCSLIVEILDSIKDVELDFDLYVGGMVQNKVGFRGSLTSTYLVKPDFAVTLEVLEVDDLKKSDDTTGALGEGVLLCYYDKSMMPNRMVLSKYKDICDKNDVKSQFYYSMESSDAGWIHKILDGCPVLKACIGGRNINTDNEMIDLSDYSSSKISLIELLKDLKESDINNFKEENR